MVQRVKGELLSSLTLMRQQHLRPTGTNATTFSSTHAVVFICLFVVQLPLHHPFVIINSTTQYRSTNIHHPYAIRLLLITSVPGRFPLVFRLSIFGKSELLHQYKRRKSTIRRLRALFGTLFLRHYHYHPFFRLL